MTKDYFRVVPIFIHKIYLNKELINNSLGIFETIIKSSKKLLLLDKNFITVLDEPLNILKKIFYFFT